MNTTYEQQKSVCDFYSQQTRKELAKQRLAAYTQEIDAEIAATVAKREGRSEVHVPHRTSLPTRQLGKGYMELAEDAKNAEMLIKSQEALVEAVPAQMPNTVQELLGHIALEPVAEQI